MLDSTQQFFRRRYLITVIAASALVFIPALLWWQSVGDISIYWRYETPPGQVYYVISRLFGMYALLAISIQILAMLLQQAGYYNFGKWKTTFHRSLGIGVVVLAIAHIVLFFIAVSLRQDMLAVHLLLPNFSDYYSTAVTFGLFAFFALLLTMFAGVLRALGKKLLVWMHYLAIPAMLLAMLHSIQVGTDTRSVYFLLIYFVIAILLVFTTVRDYILNFLR